MGGRGRRASAGPSPSSQQTGSARRNSLRRSSRGQAETQSPRSAQENVQPNAPVQPSPAKSTGASQPPTQATQSQEPAAPSLELHLGTDSQNQPTQPQPSASQPSASQQPPDSQADGAQDPLSQSMANTAQTNQTPAAAPAVPGSPGYGVTPSTVRFRSSRPELGLYSMGHVPSSICPENSEVPGMPSADGDGTYIWGTNITVAHVKHRFKRFVREFMAAEDKEAADGMEVDEEEEEREPRLPTYISLLSQTIKDEEYVVNVDGHDLAAFDKTLYDDLIKYPQEAIPLADSCLSDLALTENLLDGWVGAAGLPEQEGAAPSSPQIKARLYNLVKVHTIRDLDPDDINKLVAVTGMVTRTSSIIPDIRNALFLCERCGQEARVTHENGMIAEPKQCPGCTKQWTFKLIHNRCEFIDKQIVRLQESPNQIPEGETPHTVTTYASQETVDLVRPGDRITITGIYRALPSRVNPRQRMLSHMFRTYVDIVHVQRDEKARLISIADALNTRNPAQASQEHPTPGTPGTPGDSTSQWETDAPSQAPAMEPESLDPVYNFSTTTHEQLRAKTDRIKALAQMPDIYERLTRSLAPNVWGMEDVKKGILCQLFGGTQKIFPGGRIRGELNVLLVGDPGVSKSQLLGYVHQIAPRGIYTSGRGSSAVGLTAYVTKDPESGEMVLESGALVLSDKGVCCIDEFDKMSDSARSMLHEVMEQQTVSIAKAGLISTLNARTSVLASANPIDSRYDRNKSLVQNINLPPTLLSRFDLIYRILDECSRDSDRRLAKHLVSLYHERPPQQQYEDTLSKEELREYIAYCRLKCAPKISDAAEEALTAKYIQLRRSGRDRDIVAVTPRQLESLIRLSEAQARMTLSPDVLPVHVEEAFRLWYGAMTSCAVADNGVLDMDAITTGLSAAEREASRQLPSRLREIFSNSPNRTWGLDALVAEVAQQFNLRCQRQQLVEAILQLDDVATLHAASNTVSMRASAS